MVNLQSDVMKITYYIGDQHLARFKTSILSQVQKNFYNEYLLKLLLEVEMHIGPMLVTLWARCLSLRPLFSFKLAKLGPLMFQTWST